MPNAPRSFLWFGSILRDVRFGLRMLCKNPLVTAAAVLSLSLAIGACTAAFSLLEALILRPLPVREPDRLVYVTYASERPGDLLGGQSFSYPLFERLREAGQSHVDLFGMSYQGPQPAIFEDAGGQEERVRAQWVVPLAGRRPVRSAAGLACQPRGSCGGIAVRVRQ